MNNRLFANRTCLLLTLIMSIGFWNSAGAQSFPEVIPLPVGFYPEGIAVGDGSTAYVGSLASGSIFEADLRTGEGNVLVTGSPGLLAVGLDVDRRSGYLFVAGGFSGGARVYDTKTGQLVADLPFGGGFINDVIVTREAAFFTDSFVPLIFKVPLTSQGTPSGPVGVLPLGGDWVNEMGQINANGIVATAENSTLIVVNYFSGLIYNVDPDTGFATEMDLGGIEVPNGDGLVLRGRTLYVVQNATNQILVFTLSPDLSAATLTKVLTDDDFRIPTTADLFGSWLYAVNARFDVCPPGICDPAGLEFEIVRVDQ